MRKLPQFPTRRKSSKTLFCWAYQNDLDEAYAFYCARYVNISYTDFLKLKISDIKRKLSSIPENEPLFKIIKSRVINLSKIKDKQERKYWSDLKESNKIPDIYISREEINARYTSNINNLKEVINQ